MSEYHVFIQPRNTISHTDSQFLQRSATQSAVLLRQVVCLSVRL